MPRHIRLGIAPATATHCKACQSLCALTEKCGAFNKYPDADEEGEFLRIPECLAAEKGASE